MRKGKKIVSLIMTLAMVASMFVGMPFTVQAAADTTSGLVLQYKFDSASLNEGIVSDSSGNGHEGATAGDTLPAIVTKDGREGIQLDGVSQYVYAPAGIMNNLDDFSISFWTYLDAKQGAFTRFFDFGDTNAGKIFLTQSGFLSMNGLLWGDVIDGGDPITTGEWSHVAVTKAGNTYKLFKNGAVIKTATFNVKPSDYTAAQFVNNYIGKSNWPDPFLKGKISDFRIYNRGLTGEDVAALAGIPYAITSFTPKSLSVLITATAQQINTKLPANVTAVYSDGATANMPVTWDDITSYAGNEGVYTVYGTVAGTSVKPVLNLTVTNSALTPAIQYNFDETSGTTIENTGSLGSDYNATAAQSISSAEGMVGNALTLDGSNQYVTIPQELTFGNDLTISMWVKSNKSSTVSMMYCFGDAVNSGKMWLSQHSAQNQKLTAALEPAWGGDNRISDSKELSVNQWVHVAVTYSGKNTTLYKDGAAVETKTLALQPSDYNGQYLINYIGKSAWADPLLNGFIDDFRIYNGVLGEEEIAGMSSTNNAASVAQDTAALTLGDTSAVSRNLTLPITGSAGSTIAWSTSDAAVITDAGVITLADTEKTAVLTATITRGTESSTKEFNITVLNEDTALTQYLQTEADALSIPNSGDIRGNVTLPETTSGGATISWASDKPNVISTAETANVDYDSTPAGVVTRQDTDTQVTLTATLMYQGKSLDKVITVTVKAKAAPIADSDLKGYFYTYFRSNLYGDGESQNIHLATSKDGRFWDDMNNNEPILNATLGTKGVRDSYIIRAPEGDRFYIIGTDLDSNDGDWAAYQSNGSKSIYVWESDDLVNWSEPRLIPIAPSNAGMMWAPETIYDPNTGEYLIYFSSATPGEYGFGSSIYYVKTRDFWTFTEPKVYIPRTAENTFIDTDMIAYNGNYYRFTKNEQEVTIFLEKSDKPLGNFTLVKTKVADEPSVEGPGIFKLNGEDKFILHLDGYGARSDGFFPTIANSPEELDSGTFTALPGTDFRMPTGAKHGCVLPITQEEYDRVMAKWGGYLVEPVTPDADETIVPDVEYKFDETISGTTVLNTGKSGAQNSGTLHNGATYATDIEKGKVLYLSGGAKNTESPYLQFPDNYFVGKDNVSIVMDVKTELTIWDNFYTLSIGKDIQKYFNVKTADTQINTAFTVKSNSVYEQKSDFETSNVLNKWAKVGIILSRNEDGKHSTVSVYQDGAFKGQYTLLTANLSTMGDTLKAFIGKSFLTDPEKDDWWRPVYFKGYIDDVRVYNRALTADQIAHLDDESGPAAVTGVALNTNMLSLAKENSGQLTATVIPSNAANKNVTWTSNNDSVAIVDQTGKVTAVATGTATITVKTEEGGFEAICDVTVNQGQAPDPNLKLWYKFDEASGTTVVDSSSNGFNGTYVNTPAWSTGVSGNSFKMAGGNDSTATYVKIPNGVLNGIDNITISTWVKWDGNTVWQWLYALGVDTSKYIFTTPKSGGGVLYSAIKNGGGEQGLNNMAALQNGQWRHLAVTINSAAKTSVMYLDGVKAAENTNVTIKPSQLYDASKDYSGYIGKSFFNDPYFAGEVDDFRIYSTALTAEQVGNVYGEGMPAEQAVVLAKENLSIGRTIVIKDITLPGSLYGTDITWKSSNTTYLGDDGTVTRPAEGQPVAEAILTATISKGSITDTRTFTINILPVGYTINFTSYNPIIKTDNNGNEIFTADPGVMVDGDTVYVYAGHDEASIGGWFSINEWVCFSTKDMVNWKYEGPVMKSNDFSWATTGTAWACQVIKRNGKYYLYSTSGRPNGQGYTVGVAVSDSPTGPFIDAKGAPLFDNAITTGGTLDSMEDIDPTVFIDDDGQAYIYWGNGKLHYALLNEDMISIKDLNGDGQITEGTDIFTDVRINNIQGGYAEAPWLYKSNGKYYMVFAMDLPQKVAYAMSDSPTGPWEFKGRILDQNSDPDGSAGTYNSDTSHPAVIDFKGKSYVFYHTAALPTGGQTRRSVSVERIYYNPDGTIKKAYISSTGLTGVVSHIQSNRYQDKFVRFLNYDSMLGGAQENLQALRWEIVVGLDDEATTDMVSIQAVNHPGYYLTVNGGIIVLVKNDNTKGFKKNATFRKVPGLADPTWVSFQSVVDPTMYVRQSDSNGNKLIVASYSDNSSQTDKQDATFKILNADAAATGVKLNKSSLSLTAGSTETLLATVEPDNAANKNVSWSSSDTGIATVDSKGKITAKTIGTATITVTTEDGSFTATCNITVTAAAEKQFAISDGQLVRVGGIQASVNVAPTQGATAHEGQEVVLFQLMRGSTPASIVALKKDITSQESFKAYFNVNPGDDSYTVRVYVLDFFTSNLTNAPESLAGWVTLE